MTMEMTLREIRDNEREIRPLFNGELVFRDALSTYARLRWPSNTAKQAAREWDLSMAEGRAITSALASQATIDKILRHRNGGWAVALPVMGAVIGQGVDDFITAERKRHVQEAQRHRALVRDLRALGGDRRLSPDQRPSTRDGERKSFGRGLGEG